MATQDSGLYIHKARRGIVSTSKHSWSEAKQEEQKNQNLTQQKAQVNDTKNTMIFFIQEHPVDIHDYLGLTCFCSTEMDDLLMNSKQSAMASE